MRHIPAGIAIAMVFMAIVLFSSCDNKEQRAAHIRMLDSLLVRLDSEITAMKDVVLIPLEAEQDSVDQKVARIQAMYRGTMDEKTAALISGYRFVSKSFPDPEETALTQLNALLKSKQQILLLRNTIETEATEDALGNEISDTYLNAAAEQEKSGAEIALNDAVLVRERYRTTNETFLRLNPAIDSLLQTLNTSAPRQ